MQAKAVIGEQPAYPLQLQLGPCCTVRAVLYGKISENFIFIYIHLYSFIFICNKAVALKIKLVDLKKTDIDNIKRVITEVGGTMIPLALIFQELGFQGVTGVEWGILSGAISTVGMEMGYQLERIGRSIFLIRKRHEGGDKNAEKK